LASGRSTLLGALRADDTEAMADAVAALGAGVEWTDDTITVEGTGGRLTPGPVTVDARMSGTTARFIAPVLALGSGEYTLTGHPQLQARPLATVVDLLAQLGASAAPDHLPMVITGAGGIAGGTVTVPGDVSSQFLSGLLLAAPMASAPLTIEVEGDLVSRPYIVLTEAVMADFGASIDSTSGYRPTTRRIEPDASAASYFFAAAAILGGRVTIAGLGTSTVQGDLRFVEVLQRMGCEVEMTEDTTTVRNDGSLRGGEFDLADFSDTAPTLGVVAAFADSPTRVTGIGFIRRKETDRIKAVVTELRRCGVDAEEEPDGFLVRPSAAGPHAAEIHTYDDHRMAMAFAVLGLAVPGTTILDPDCVAKTFPTFFSVLDRLR
jgi:3-phosphoshikimate 1-carboxyvinyltransferase